VLDLRELAIDIGEPAILPTVGHELRTPLTSICGYLETVLDGEIDADTTRRFLQTALREAQRLAALIETLLREAPKARGRSVCDVAEQIRRVVETLAPLARRRSITMRTTLPAHAIARVGADECIHALTNLIENAIKHGRTHGTVAVHCRRSGAHVDVTIDDDGEGIGSRGDGAWSALFEPGVRGTTRTQGCGIGLAVVRAIAHRGGGSVVATKSPMGGARFVLRLRAG
jgi:signal transduction histidine kinase